MPVHCVLSCSRHTAKQPGLHIRYSTSVPALTRMQKLKNNKRPKPRTNLRPNPRVNSNPLSHILKSSPPPQAPFHYQHHQHPTPSSSPPNPQETTAQPPPPPTSRPSPPSPPPPKRSYMPSTLPHQQPSSPLLLSPSRTLPCARPSPCSIRSNRPPTRRHRHA